MDRTDRAAASQVLLLADDSATIQRVIELTFSGEDVTVIAVGDGEQAIARIPVDLPDIILADIGMPKRNGYDVSAFVKGHPEYKHIPVLLLAGAFEPVDQQRAEQVGCNGVLVKPFEPQHVIARVRELLDGAKGTPMQATADVARPVERLAAPRTLEFPRREEPKALQADTEPKALQVDTAPKVLQVDPAPKALQVDPAPKALQVDPAPKALQVDAAPPPEPVTPAPDPVDEFDFIHRPQPDALDSMAQPLGADESLDDYFDRLDAAFSTLDTPSIEAPSSQPRAATALEVQPDVPTLEDLLGPDFAAPPAPIDLPLHGVTAPRSLVADAFAALLAVEQGEPGATPVRLTSGAAEPVITDALLDELTRRIIQRLAPDQVRQVVAQVVSEVAERLVREEIERIRNRM